MMLQNLLQFHFENLNFKLHFTLSHVSVWDIKWLQGFSANGSSDGTVLLSEQHNRSQVCVCSTKCNGSTYTLAVSDGWTPVIDGSANVCHGYASGTVTVQKSGIFN